MKNILYIYGNININNTYRSDTSDEPNKQTLRFPSAVIRKRLQEVQKFLVIDVIKPICPL